jgi:CBS domain-containing protein
MAEKTFSENRRRRCREIMTSNVQTATREMTLQEIARLMRDGDMGAMPIVENGKLVGIVTDRDIVVRAIAEGKNSDAQSATCDDDRNFSVKPDDFAFEAIRLMGDRQVRRVPVVSETGELAGIIAMADVALEMEDEREIAETWKKFRAARVFGRKISRENADKVQERMS